MQITLRKRKNKCFCETLAVVADSRRQLCFPTQTKEVCLVKQLLQYIMEVKPSLSACLLSVAHCIRQTGLSFDQFANALCRSSELGPILQEDIHFSLSKQIYIYIYALCQLDAKRALQRAFSARARALCLRLCRANHHQSH